MLAECHRNVTVIWKGVEADCSETLVATCKTEWCHNPLDCKVRNSVCKILALFFAGSSTDCYYGFGMSYLLWAFELKSVEKHFDYSFVTDRYDFVIVLIPTLLMFIIIQ